MILPIITANINQKLPIIESEIALNGKVIQVMESSGITQLRIAVNDDYDTVVLVEYDSSISPSRILDNDYVNIFGNYIGLFTKKAS